ncbi:Crp/Fnr family transcriptional regulator [Paenisporosarcina cavernae]|uniref:Crp/Fnr family transcriptional regulator n=1 Tax=Paenisporosarcina cavernae TaxID=2320858 RepID=A0A385YRC0_9BACL|nr:Crp/Fnr family transcriptional regulator [Paenisporosarcina cavernae]AYC28547.1 Crp/Fnr family transcriptional regulator [Paenisporosarcina cavernae]
MYVEKETISNDLQELLTLPHHVKHFTKDTYLFREGDPIKYLYFLVKGKVQLSKVTSEGRELTLRICGRNQLLGEVYLYTDDSSYMLDAKVKDDVECFVFPLEELEKELQHNARLATAFMKWMCTNQQKTQTRFRDLILHGKKGALYSTLIRLSNSYGIQRADGILIDVQLTNQELANFCGMAREVANRLLGDLKKNEIVSSCDGKLLIRNLKFLQDEIQCEHCPATLCRID